MKNNPIKALIQTLIESLKVYCINEILKEDDWIFEIAINLFNDGECIDVGAKIVVCDLPEENFQNTYYSFTLGNKELSEPVLKYIKGGGPANEWRRQLYLAECLKQSLLTCDWIDRRTNIYIEEYD